MRVRLVFGGFGRLHRARRAVGSVSRFGVFDGRPVVEIPAGAQADDGRVRGVGGHCERLQRADRRRVFCGGDRAGVGGDGGVRAVGGGLGGGDVGDARVFRHGGDLCGAGIHVASQPRVPAVFGAGIVMRDAGADVSCHAERQRMGVWQVEGAGMDADDAGGRDRRPAGRRLPGSHRQWPESRFQHPALPGNVADAGCGPGAQAGRHRSDVRLGRGGRGVHADLVCGRGGRLFVRCGGRRRVSRLGTRTGCVRAGRHGGVSRRHHRRAGDGDHHVVRTDAELSDSDAGHAGQRGRLLCL